MGLQITFLGSVLSPLKHYTKFSQVIFHLEIMHGLKSLFATCDKSNYEKLMHGIFFQVWIDNFVFRLHCKVTVFILFVACVLVSVGQFFGDPIDCIVAVSCS